MDPELVEPPSEDRPIRPGDIFLGKIHVLVVVSLLRHTHQGDRQYKVVSFQKRDEGFFGGSNSTYTESVLLSSHWARMGNVARFVAGDKTSLVEVPLSPELLATITEQGSKHYKTVPIEPLVFSHANGLGIFEFNVIKYVVRCTVGGSTSPLQDIAKAVHYLSILQQKIQDGFKNNAAVSTHVSSDRCSDTETDGSICTGQE